MASLKETVAERQATTCAKTDLVVAFHEFTSEMKGQMSTFKSEMKDEMSNFKGDVVKMMSEFEGEMNSSFHEFKSEMNSSFQQFKGEVSKMHSAMNAEMKQHAIGRVERILSVLLSRFLFCKYTYMPPSFSL